METTIDEEIYKILARAEKYIGTKVKTDYIVI